MNLVKRVMCPAQRGTPAVKFATCKEASAINMSTVKRGIALPLLTMDVHSVPDLGGFVTRIEFETGRKARQYVRIIATSMREILAPELLADIEQYLEPDLDRLLAQVIASGISMKR